MTYQGIPEAVVRRDHPSVPNGAYDDATLSAAAASSGVLNIPLYFENVSDASFIGRTRAKAIVSQNDGGRVDTVSIRASKVAGFGQLPGADSTSVYNFRLNVSAIRGASTIRPFSCSAPAPGLAANRSTIACAAARS